MSRRKVLAHSLRQHRLMIKRKNDQKKEANVSAHTLTQVSLSQVSSPSLPRASHAPSHSRISLNIPFHTGSSLHPSPFPGSHKIPPPIINLYVYCLNDFAHFLSLFEWVNGLIYVKLGGGDVTYQR